MALQKQGIKNISCVIPVYNAERTIKETVLSLRKIFSESQYRLEIILVNDGSRDTSGEICSKLALTSADTIYIELSRNFGQHNALLQGIRASTGTYVICMDDDMETPPGEAMKLLTAMEQFSYDVVYGQYKRGEGFRRFGSDVNNLMANIVFHKSNEIQLNSYFIMNRFVANEIITYDAPYVYLPGLIFHVTNRIGGVPVIHRMGNVRASRYRLGSLIALWLSGVTNYSILPLRLSVALGFLSAAFGFGLAVFEVIQKIMDPDIFMGWTSLMVVHLMFSGIVLMSVGVLGEYVGRIFYIINHGPQGVVRRTIKNGKPHNTGL
jgi:undecaprenyl-phosphate 4-deoxy-4-formamido-L-arabinose transferase